MKLHNRKPDINEMYKVLRREAPSRPVFFELFMNGPLYERLAGRKMDPDAPDRDLEWLRFTVEAYAAAGYDYATTHPSGFGFPAESRGHVEGAKTCSLNSGFVITDEASFEAYKWPNPEDFDYSRIFKIKPYLPDGLKLMAMGPGGVLENVIRLVGYDNLCAMIYDTPHVAKAVFDHVGERLVKHYKICVESDTIGIIMSNDDWGFKTQPFLSPDQMREYVFPWHKKIVEVAHNAGIPAILHSCGNASELIDDIADYMKFDGRHSHEDIICPVEECYEKWHDRFAIIGGIDVDFITRATPEEITKRCVAMLDRVRDRGGFALGTGNSVPEYIPQENFLAMIKAGLDY